MFSMKQLVLIFALFFPVLAAAASPTFVTPTDSDAYTQIDEPTIQHAYYGELHDFPHSYKVITDKPLVLSLEILEPNIKRAHQNMNGIIVREVERGVEEVARLQAHSAEWETSFDAKTGDSYRHGGSFNQEIPPGTYYIEVSNGDNAGNYVLQVGTEVDPQEVGLLSTMKDIYKIKRFFGKPFFMVLQSPYYYVPALLIAFLTFVWYQRRRKHQYA